GTADRGRPQGIRPGAGSAAVNFGKLTGPRAPGAAHRRTDRANLSLRRGSVGRLRRRSGSALRKIAYRRNPADDVSYRSQFAAQGAGAGSSDGVATSAAAERRRGQLHQLFFFAARQEDPGFWTAPVRTIQ